MAQVVHAITSSNIVKNKQLREKRLFDYQLVRCVITLDVPRKTKYLFLTNKYIICMDIVLKMIVCRYIINSK